ncbi:MAG: dihydrofolate reductase [Pseudomonadota bacterium]
MSDAAVTIALVVARAENGVIGRKGDLPWRIPSDLKRFKQVTLGKPVVMGRKTWQSLPRRPLPGRPNLVVSRSLRAIEGAEVFADLGAALSRAGELAGEAGEVCVIGGAQIYADALDRAGRIYLTEVALSPQGDALFPRLDPAQWVERSAERVEPGEGDEAGFTVRVLERKT